MDFPNESDVFAAILQQSHVSSDFSKILCPFLTESLQLC